MNSLLQANQIGQSLWIDNLSRTLLREGTLKQLIEEDGISGVTSNPTIFQKALAESPYYREELEKLESSDLSPLQRYETLVVPDIQEACDLLRPVFDRTGGNTGYVSLEVPPALAHDEEGTVQEALRLSGIVDRINLLVKVPSTPEGIKAFERLIAQGVNINVTLMFSLQHELHVAQAYIRGAQKWVETGGDPGRLKSVASIFLSRVDTLVDKKLEQIGSESALELRGKTALALAKLTYQRYREFFHGNQFADLASKGVRPQYPLWASTSTKNPNYSDILYVEPLIGPETVNTLPDNTITAFRDHGKAADTLSNDVIQAQTHFIDLEKLGIDMQEVGEQLQREGVKSFADSFDKLLSQVA